jgi:hypothetical protein
MKKLLSFGLAPLILAAAVSSRAQNAPVQQTITLYAPQYGGDFARTSVDLQSATYAPRLRFGDVGYGLLRTGTESDWLEISTTQDRRSVVRDLGAHAWADSFMVPWIEPLAKLKPGETRQVFATSTGADGKGASGGRSWEGLSALPSGGGGTNPSACCESTTGTIDRTTVREESKRRPTRPAGVETSSNMLRAVIGHMYVVHVVDDRRDFYALFRVEALQRGNNCTISWKIIPPPLQPTTVKN